MIAGQRNSVLAVYSLSKQSNLAGYRAAFVAGCSDLIDELFAVRKHAGLIPPAPVQAAMIAALADETHVAEQKERYRARRATLAPALEAAGFRIDESAAGLYLWATKGEDSWATVAELAELGILVVPGSFYGEQPPRHVRIAPDGSGCRDRRRRGPPRAVRLTVGFLQQDFAAFSTNDSGERVLISCKRD